MYARPHPSPLPREVVFIHKSSWVRRAGSAIRFGIMNTTISYPEWIQTELGRVDLGDHRLNKRMGLVLEELSRQPEKSICAATSGLNEMMGAYRFFHNSKVTAPTVLSPHRQATEQRAAQQERVVAIQDTSQLDFSGRQPISGAGYLEGATSQGFFFHPLLVVTAERLPLGTLWFKVWGRQELNIRDTRRERPLEQKESVRWLEGYREACALAERCPQTQVICVQDAEADVFELPLLAQAKAAAGERHAEFIIRAAQDRRTDSQEGKLWAQLLASPVLGKLSCSLPRREQRPVREATLEVRAQEVTLLAPQRTQGPALSSLRIWAVLAREVDPPAGSEPVEWLLLTSRPADTLTAAVQILQDDSCRWEVEIFFRVLKTGCQVERLQFEQGNQLLPAFALYAIVAWRILYLVHLGRSVPQLSCAALLDPDEWKAVWVVTKRQAPPRAPPALQEMIRLIARLGGYKGRKGDGEPGPQAMWQGLLRAFDFALAWKAFGPEKDLAYG